MPSTPSLVSVTLYSYIPACGNVPKAICESFDIVYFPPLTSPAASSFVYAIPVIVASGASCVTFVTEKLKVTCGVEIPSANSKFFVTDTVAPLSSVPVPTVGTCAANTEVFALTNNAPVNNNVPNPFLFIILKLLFLIFVCLLLYKRCFSRSYHVIILSCELRSSLRL